MESTPLMTITVNSRVGLKVPPSVQRQAGIKSGDRLEFTVSSGTIMIASAKPATYKPTRSDAAATRRGQAALARGESTPLRDFPRGHARIGAAGAPNSWNRDRGERPDEERPASFVGTPKNRRCPSHPHKIPLRINHLPRTISDSSPPLCYS